MDASLHYVSNRSDGAPLATPRAALAASAAAVAEDAPGPIEFHLPLARKPEWRRPRLSGVWSWSGGPWVQLLYVLADAVSVWLIGATMFSLRFLADPFSGLMPAGWNWQIVPDEYLGFLALYAVLVVLSCHSQDLYRTVRTRTALDESMAVFKAVAFATLLLTAFLYISGARLSRIVVLATGVLTLVLLVAWRLTKKRVIERRTAHGVGVTHALIVGAGRVGQALSRYLEENQHLGYVVKGFLDHNHTHDPRRVGRIEDLPALAQAHFVDEVFITIPSERELVKRVALEARRHRLNVKVVPELYDGLAWHAPFEYVGEFPVSVLHREPIPAIGLVAKRAMDLACSAAALAVLSPLLLAIAVLITLDSRGPVFYLAPRAGRKGRPFICCKFRTMVSDADATKAALRARNERVGPTFKITNDPRITRVGRWLRKFSLDELPQFWNVLLGDMSMVGPRPHPLDDVHEYRLEHLRRLDVKPGITGLWQVTARKDPSFERNLELDLEYIETWSLWLDTKILLRTLPAAVNGTGA
jgi:exopolysaccharide biosynthesis polyprenyl glycosylphosphotransferase